MSDDCIWSTWMWQNWTTMNFGFSDLSSLSGSVVFPKSSLRLSSFKILLDIGLFMFPLWRAAFHFKSLRLPPLCNSTAKSKLCWERKLRLMSGISRSNNLNLVNPKSQTTTSIFLLYIAVWPTRPFFPLANTAKKETTLSLMFPSSFSVRVPFPCVILGQTCLNGNAGCLLPIKGTEDYGVPNVGVAHMWTFVSRPSSSSAEKCAFSPVKQRGSWKSG